MGGPSVFPPQPDGPLAGGLQRRSGPGPTSKGEDRYRRGLYTFWRRTVPYPSMATFDAPSREICTVRRVRTNTPLQALVTLNDPVYVEAAQALARRIVAEGGADGRRPASASGSELCLGRPAGRRAGRGPRRALRRASSTATEATPTRPRRMATDPLGPLPAGMDAAELAAWTVGGQRAAEPRRRPDEGADRMDLYAQTSTGPDPPALPQGLAGGPRRHRPGGAPGPRRRRRAGADSSDNPLAPRPPHFAAKAKRVIYLHMSGAPPQLDLFDYKPELVKHDLPALPRLRS